MSHLLYIERLIVTALLLLLLALAPAMAQDVVYTGEPTPLSVEPGGADNYHWELYSDPTVNFAVTSGDPSPTAYAEFIGPDDGSTVYVKFKLPGTFYFKVTALDAAGCAMNLKIGKITVEKALTNLALTATKTDAACVGDKGFIQFSTLNVKEGTYTIKYDDGHLSVDIKADGTGSVAVPAGEYNNLILFTDNYNTFNASKIVNVKVSQPKEIDIAAKVTRANLLTNSKAFISLNVTGGSGKYTYQWDNGQTTRDINNLDIGVYTVTVTDQNGCPPIKKEIEVQQPDRLPRAVDDQLTIDCRTSPGSVLINDSIAESYRQYIRMTIVRGPEHGTLNLNPDGTFEYKVDPLYVGMDSFEYSLFDKNRYPASIATVNLTIIVDFDHDGIADDDDSDVDGDGIRNEKEVLAGQDWKTEDTDKDGLPNFMDIDADGDGIVDNYEAQSSRSYKKAVIYDANSNGLNDAYDGRQSRFEIDPMNIDYDEDGFPDFLDTDSDNDSVPDRIEGHDKNADGLPEHVAKGNEDSDHDGLNDAFDTVVNDCDGIDNMTGSNAAMQDFEGDGVPDWRDDNDDNDNHLTIREDMDGDGDYSNDDYDLDGHPEYLDSKRECELFIPNAFSPNVPKGDGIHDYFQIYCISEYPNAKIYIFDQQGNKLFEKLYYGNETKWGTEEGAPWWDGNADRGRGRGERVAPGTYFYVLDLGNGDVKKGFVFVSY